MMCLMYMCSMYYIFLEFIQGSFRCKHEMSFGVLLGKLLFSPCYSSFCSLSSSPLKNMNTDLIADARDICSSLNFFLNFPEEVLLWPWRNFGRLATFLCMFYLQLMTRTVVQLSPWTFEIFSNPFQTDISQQHYFLSCFGGTECSIVYSKCFNIYAI